MPAKFEIYKCEMCGNIVEMVHGGVGTLVCCGQPMKLYTENSVDAAKEKHVPVVEKTADAIKVSVGSVNHPMEEKHYIEWIELLTADKSYTCFLEPGQEPKAVFCHIDAAQFTVRAYCNLHGLWKNA